ncbi:alpha/beta hydrolase [Nocardioides sp.]|uniref:alpha/beta fold hydrolase n=1 Tax=Nocardioides sp. TaxID=35761 RepID=UPI0026196423|nr:alpha/beta hydrolase [Nocardioides sp.]MCW2736489.1 alpha/beta hydrolase [Nocardioides sp.]
MRPVLALLLSCVLVSGCAEDSSDERPTATPQTSVAPVTEPAADLHVECAGDGSPTVVLIAGLNTSGDTFRDLRSRLSGTARTCFYDRAGIGDSPPLPDEAPDPSPGSAAADLRAALAAEGLEPPYVVLGWSYGGLVAQAWATEFPEDLAGVVLEDPSVREQFTAAALADPSIDWAEGGRSVDRDALVDELARIDLGDLPVVVLSQDARGGWVAPWYRSHDRLARVSTDGVHAVGLGSGHAMHEDVPRLVAAAVEAVWSAASAGTGLPACRTVFRGERVRCRV